MIVTFDSNVWRKVASPMNFPKDPEHKINEKLNLLIKQGQIKGYLSETIFTLEAIKRVDRKKVFKIYRPNIDVKIQDNSMINGNINLTLTMGPGKENQPELNYFLREHLNDAVGAGFEIIHLPRIGGFLNEEADKYRVVFEGNDLKKYLDKVIEVAQRIESMNCGFKWIETIGLKYDQKVFNGIGKAPTSEDNNIANAVAEWADGDTVACAVGIGSDFICTNDRGKAAGSNSVFATHNINVLSNEYGFQLINLQKLADLF
jgi:hypothetical protein